MGLTSFARYQKLLKYDFPAQVMGFNVKKPNSPGKVINTFQARFRVAKSFNGIDLEGYAKDTVAGYSALFQVFLSYSAFEQFMALYSHKGPYDPELEDKLIPYQPGIVAENIRTLDKNWKFVNFLQKNANEKLQERLEAFKQDETNNVVVLASAVRHIFAHGTLTPNSEQLRPNVVCPVCHSLSDFLLNFMDTEFTNQIDFVYAREEERGLTRRLDRKK